MKISFVKFGTLIMMSLIFLSCREQVAINEESDAELLGFQEFKNVVLPALGNLKTTLINDESLSLKIATRSESELPAELIEFFNVLSEETLSLLESNEIDVSEFMDVNDPRLAIVGMALIEAERAAITTRTSLGGCVLQAVGVGELVKGAGKAVAKSVAKAILKKIPYVGAVLMAADFVWCMAE